MEEPTDVKMKCGCCPEKVPFDAGSTCNSCHVFYCKPCLEKYEWLGDALCVRCAFVISKDIDSVGFDADFCCLKRTVDTAARLKEAVHRMVGFIDEDIATSSSVAQPDANIDPAQQAISTNSEEQLTIKMKVTALDSATVHSGGNISVGSIKAVAMDTTSLWIPTDNVST